MWVVKDAVDGLKKEEILNKMKAMLQVLPSKIEEIKTFEIGENFNPNPHAYELSLNSSFETKEDLLIYANHSEHVIVAAYFNQVAEKKAVVDYFF